MNKVVYLDKDDAILFEQLRSKGLTQKQAVEQMKILGLENKIEINAMYDYSPIRVNSVIYDEYKPSSFDRYKLDWYVGFFLDINFSNFSKINEYVNNNPNYIGDVSYYLYYFNGYLVIDIIAFTDRDDEFENLVLNCIKNRDTKEKEIFDLILKDSITRVSVRKDSISDYVAPIQENYIRFGYLDDDDIDVINKFNYSEYDKIIGNIDFSNYSVFYRKRK